MGLSRTGAALQTASDEYRSLQSCGRKRDADRLCMDVCDALAPLVGKFARRLATRVISRDELTAASHAAIYQALEDYRPDCGTSFKTYVYGGIQGRLYNYLRIHAGTAVHLPAWIKDARPKVRRALAEFRPGEEVSVQTVADACNLSVKNAAIVLHFLDHDARVLRFAPYTSMAQGEVDPERHPACAVEWIEQADQRLTLEQYLSRLEPDDAALLRRVYFDRESVADVACEIGITRQAVDLRVKRALKKLRLIIPAGTF